MCELGWMMASETKRRRTVVLPRVARCGFFFTGGISAVSSCDVTKKGHMLVVVVMVNSGGGGNGEEAGWWWSQTIVRESVCRARQVVGCV